jgi:hypothetical protein
MCRSLTAVLILLLLLAPPLGVARATDDSAVDSGVAERPTDVPSWLIASRLGRPAGEGDDEVGGGGLRDLDAVLLRESPTPIEPDPLTLRTSGEDSSDLRAFLGQGERWRLMSFGANAGSRPQDVRISAYGAVAYVPGLSLTRPEGGPGFGPAAAPGVGVGPADPEEPVSLGFKSRLGAFGLEGGADYRSVGKRLERVVPGPASQKDREGTELWLAQRVGALRLQISQSALSDNVDRDPSLPRTTRDQIAVSAQITPRGGPIFGLTYATGDSEKSWLTADGRARSVDRQRYDSVAGSAYYGTSWFDFTGSSTYSFSRTPGRTDRDVTSLYHDVSVTLRPVKVFAVTPSVGSGVDRSEWGGTSYESGSMSLLLTYTPTATRLSLWTLGAYTTSQASDRTMDGRTLSVSAGLSYGLGALLGAQTTVSLQAGYDRYEDAIYPDVSTRGAFGLVLFRVAAF